MLRGLSLPVLVEFEEEDAPAHFGRGTLLTNQLFTECVEHTNGLGSFGHW